MSQPPCRVPLSDKPRLRSEGWARIRAAGVARFPGVEGRIPNFVGAEAAAERLAATEIWRTAPYLYDGRAETLESLFTEHNPDDLHGETSDLSDTELTLSRGSRRVLDATLGRQR